ncbi:serine carboxypeptidase S28 family protein [Carex rostrata]
MSSLNLVHLLLFLFLFPVLISSSPYGPTYPQFLGRFSHRKFKNSNYSSNSNSYSYETRYYTQQVDHFSFIGDTQGDSTFQQRYLLGSTDKWARPRGPIFFYCGNEGDILWFAENTGFIWEIAPRFNALVVFAEHRYYGESMPYGSKDAAYSGAKSLAYLTAEQALADYATLLIDLKHNMSSEDSPVVLFGGSYAGMLAAWMRLKYPNIAIGALASSAPILQFDDIVPADTFYNIVSNDFKRESESCFNSIKKSWDVLQAEGNDQNGLLKLTKTFRICDTLNNTGDLLDWIDSAYSYLAMVDYPCPSDFLMPLPANPIKEVCRHIDDDSDGKTLAERIYAGVNVYYNYTGNYTCFDLDDDPHGMNGWQWQACTEMIMPFASNPETSMFPPYDFSLADRENECRMTYNVSIRPRWITTEFGGHNISTVLEKFGSNIIFSNGLLDPWSGGGVLKNISESIIALVAPLGAHHIDLRPSTDEDPDWLVNFRETEINIIKGWLSDYYNAIGASFSVISDRSEQDSLISI